MTESSGSGGSGLLKWLAGILATVISSVAVFHLTKGPEAAQPPAQERYAGVVPAPSALVPRESREPEPRQQSEMPDLGGIWRGALYQPTPAGVVAYPYQVDLSQDGNAVEGTARLQAPMPYGYYIEMNIRGSIRQGSLRFDDGPALVNSAPLGWIWCQKAVALRYDQATGSLQGTWEQPGCGSGQIQLAR